MGAWRKRCQEEVWAVLTDGPQFWEAVEGAAGRGPQSRHHLEGMKRASAQALTSEALRPPRAWNSELGVAAARGRDPELAVALAGSVSATSPLASPRPRVSFPQHIAVRFGATTSVSRSWKRPMAPRGDYFLPVCGHPEGA